MSLEIRSFRVSNGKKGNGKNGKEQPRFWVTDHLLSNFYNQTRAEYYRQLAAASRSAEGPMAFVAYAVRGLRDALYEQIGHACQPLSWVLLWVGRTEAILGFSVAEFDRKADPWSGRMPAANAENPADRVVEVYAAANAIEAHELCAVLAEEGIQSQVVGEQLGGAAGCLPLGEAIAPRIWVREADAARSRKIINEWTSQSHQEWLDPLDGDDQDELDEETEENAPQASGDWCRWFGQALAMVSAVCFVLGSVWAAYDGIALHTHQGLAKGKLVARLPYFSFSFFARLAISWKRSAFSVEPSLRCMAARLL